MRRILSLNLPGFAVDRLCRDSALVLVATSRGTQRVTGCSVQAARFGVRTGMSVAHARALVGEGAFELEDADPTGDRRALEELGAWAMRFSPLVGVDPPDGLLLDVVGVERLFGSEARLLERVLDAFEARGFRARGAVAGTIGCAWALARFGSERLACAASGDEREALAPLPIEALRLEPRTVEGLVELGLERVEHLFALDRKKLPARFEEGLLLRLDQALGRAFEPLVPLRPVVRPRADYVFEEPVELDVVEHVLSTLLERLLGPLRSRDEGVRQLELRLLCAEAEPVHETLVLSRPSNDFDHLWPLLERPLERAPFGFGVERIDLAFSRTMPIPSSQLASWEAKAPARASAPDRALGELLDHLVGRLGRARIRRVEAVASHLPEEAFRERSVLDPAPDRNAAVENGASLALARPSHFYDPPHPMAVETQGSVPVRFQWQGEWREVVRHWGPERIRSPWWKAKRRMNARDYYRVEDRDGLWLWLGRDPEGRWFAHGEWS